MNQNKEKDHVVLKGKNNVLISAPHGVSQVRLGKYKYSEIGSLTTALYLFENSNCFLIAKTQNNNDDANFDEKSKYKNSIEKFDIMPSSYICSLDLSHHSINKRATSAIAK